MKQINNLSFVALVATLLLQTSIARADDEGSNNRVRRNAEATWTKWVDARAPNVPAGMFATVAGISGGDIGDGIMTGEAFTPIVPLPGGAITFTADYHFHGSKHSLTVRFIVTQQPPNADGVIIGVVEGVVTEGWLKGNQVKGAYVGRPCGPGEGRGLSPCFDGSLEIERGTKHQD